MTPVLVHWDNFIGSRYMHAVHYCGCTKTSGLSLVANGWPT